MEPEVEVLGQAVGPRRPAERPESDQPRELAVSSQADGADAVAGRLREVAEPDELEILAARQQAFGRVTDDDAHLHAAYARVGEQAGDLAERLRLELAVGVDDPEDDLLGIEARDERMPLLEQLVEHAVALVQHCALAASRELRRTRHDEHAARGLERLRDLGGAVGRPVVDDDHEVALVVELEQALERVREHELLVVRGDDERHRRQQWRARVAA